MYEKILTKAEKESVSPEEALLLLNEATTMDKLLALFKTASKVRGQEVGDTFKFDGFIGTLTDCTIDPPCKYCSRSLKDGKSSFSEPLTIQEVRLAAKFVSECHVKMVEIGGGTGANDASTKIIAAVKAIKEVDNNLGIWINVGPSLCKDDLIELKELGVKEICCSLETCNPQVFAATKPGDSLDARKKLASEIDEVGIGLTSVMMVGLGSSYQNYVDHIFWLNNFQNLSHFPVTGLRPIPGAGMSNHKTALTMEVAKVGAVARLILRDVDISFGGMMNDPQFLPIWVMAGANRAIHLGPHVHRPRMQFKGMKSSEIVTKTVYNLEYSDRLPLTCRIIKGLGMKPDLFNKDKNK
ncbi:radical SAM protein [Desulfobacula sp.]|uniref:radical SAM protein n=1 Tax=Desulfobacula sp. TaxID=2593537 RepID=UPI002633304F|nr:radical SAM protein [Desulfobacula sp.]